MTSLAQAAEKAREWTLKRDHLIRKDSRPLRQVAEDAGLSHSAIAKIKRKSSDT